MCAADKGTKQQKGESVCVWCFMNQEIVTFFSSVTLKKDQLMQQIVYGTLIFNHHYILVAIAKRLCPQTGWLAEQLSGHKGFFVNCETKKLAQSLC